MNSFRINLSRYFNLKTLLFLTDRSTLFSTVESDDSGELYKGTL